MSIQAALQLLPSLAIEMCPNKLPSTVYDVATGSLNSVTTNIMQNNTTI